MLAGTVTGHMEYTLHQKEIYLVYVGSRKRKMRRGEEREGERGGVRTWGFGKRGEAIKSKRRKEGESSEESRGGEEGF